MNGEPVNCLFDTGDEVTLIPGSLVQELSKRPVVLHIPVNRTLVEVLGQVDLQVVLMGRDILIRGVASDNVA